MEGYTVMYGCEWVWIMFMHIFETVIKVIYGFSKGMKFH